MIKVTINGVTIEAENVEQAKALVEAANRENEQSEGCITKARRAYHDYKETKCEAAAASYRRLAAASPFGGAFWRLCANLCDRKAQFHHDGGFIGY